MTSTIKVDNIQKTSDDSNIIKKCGSTTTVGSGSGQTIVVDGATVTLGRCGGAVNLASGATQSGFGDPASAVLFCTTAKTSPFTAANKVGYFVNTSGGAVTVTLPSSPSAGDIVAFKDYGGTWNAACKAVTLNRNGSKINGSCGNATLNVKNQSITLVYVDGTKGWQDIQDSTAGVTGNITYNVEYLVVAGGGGASGPSNYGGGGGGAGGYRTATGFPVGTNCGPYPITVGAGGAASSSSPACNGANSVFSTITSAGGGGAGGAPSGVNSGVGGDGGSGGGASYGTGGSGNTPPVSPPQGNDGSPGVVGSSNVRSGGGGGAAAAGTTSGSANVGGDGGIGATTAIFGSAPQAPTYGTPGPAPGRYFAGGGAARGGANNPGASGSPGTGGSGGGGTPSGANGTTNTGGGAAGNRLSAGGVGGSGIVVIKHATADASPAVSGGDAVLTCGSNTIRVFTSDGTFTP